jgi:hypothetical protein
MSVPLSRAGQQALGRPAKRARILRGDKEIARVHETSGRLSMLGKCNAEPTPPNQPRRTELRHRRDHLLVRRPAPIWSICLTC